jgi:hypothetical protein
MENVEIFCQNLFQNERETTDKVTLEENDRRGVEARTEQEPLSAQVCVFNSTD